MSGTYKFVEGLSETALGGSLYPITADTVVD